MVISRYGDTALSFGGYLRGCNELWMGRELPTGSVNINNLYVQIINI